MRRENIKDALGLKRASVQDELKEIEPRTLSQREAGWVRDILQVNPEWCNADTRMTNVVAEGPNSEGYSILLQAPSPENLRPKSSSEMVGQLWIYTDDQSTINVQLSQCKGSLQGIYVLFLDRNGRNRTVPETWNEVSREAVIG